MGDILQNTGNACQNSRQTDNRVKHCDSLGQLSSCHTPTNESTQKTSNGSNACKLPNDFYRETDSREGSKDTGSNTEDTENIPLPGGGLRSETR